MRRWFAIAVLLCSFAAAQPAERKDEAVHVTMVPSAIQWTPGPAALPPGAQMAVLEGDLTRPGYFAVRIKLPAGYRIPPHFHPVQERVTVVEGAFSLGTGERFDESKLKDYPAGSYLSMPRGMRHFVVTRQGSVVQLQTIGPWGITYVNPADDPRNQGAQKSGKLSRP